MTKRYCLLCLSDVEGPHEHPTLRIRKAVFDALWPPRSPKQEEPVSEVHYLPIRVA